MQCIVSDMTQPPDNLPPRYAPARALPPYSYVPGKFPHPISDPAGHSFGHTNAPQADEFLYAVDLFNHGYYWEAHEAWELLWHAAGRSGWRADFFKGLIKLAAAGVKAREANVHGKTRHAKRAQELFASVRAADMELLDGCSLTQLLALATEIEGDAQSLINTCNSPVLPIFSSLILIASTGHVPVEP